MKILKGLLLCIAAFFGVITVGLAQTTKENNKVQNSNPTATAHVALKPELILAQDVTWKDQLVNAVVCTSDTKNDQMLVSIQSLTGKTYASAPALAMEFLVTNHGKTIGDKMAMLQKELNRNDLKVTAVMISATPAKSETKVTSTAPASSSPAKIAMNGGAGGTN